MHFYFQAKTQHENLGDRGIARALLALAAARGAVHVNTRGCPADYTAELRQDGHHIVDVHPLRLAWRAALHRLTGARVVFLMKPGHFSGHDGGIAARLAQLFGLLCMKSTGVAICRFGASVGPFTGAVARIERLAARLYTRYTVREPLSQAYCASLGIRRVTYFPDLAFCLPPSFTLQGSPRAERDIDCAFSFRDAGADNTQIHAVIEAFERHTPNATAAYAMVTQVSRDRPFNARLARLLSPRPCAQVNNDVGGAAAVFDIYGRSRMVLSNRLHVLLFGAAAGALPIALVSSQANAKIVGVYQAAGLERLLLHTDTGEAIATQLHRVIRDELLLREALQAALRQQRQLLLQMFDQAFD